MSSVTLEDLEAITRKYNDGWQAFNKMESLCREEPAGTLVKLLWEGMRTGRLHVGGYQSGWYQMVQISEHYDAGDFVKLLKAIEVEEKKMGYSFSSSMPGWPSNLNGVLEVKKGDEAFFKALAGLFDEVPDGNKGAVAVHLAKRGVLSIEEIPAGTKEAFAMAYLKESWGDWGDAMPWSDEEWGRALVEAALSGGVDEIESKKAPKLLAAAATDEEFPRVIALMRPQTDERLPEVEALGSRPGARKLLEEHLRSVGDLSAEKYKPNRGFYPVLAYLWACMEEGVEPAEDLDDRLGEFIGTYSPSWSGGSFEKYHQRMQGLLRAIPAARLEKIIVGAKNTPWLLAGAASGLEVARRIATDLAGVGKGVSYDFPTYRNIALASMGEHGVQALSEALEAGAGDQREEMVQALGSYGAAEAVPTLVTMLGDTSKGVVTAARTALLAAPVEIVLEALPDALGARKKGPRLGAAEVLAALPPTAKGYELAQEYAEKEKTADVKALLEGVQEPSGDGALQVDTSGRVAEIREAISGGASWSDFFDDGEAVIDAFVEVLGEKNINNTWNPWGQERGSLLAIISRHKDSEYVLRAFIELLGGVYGSGAQGLLSGVYEEAPKVADELAAALAQGRIARPAGFGPAPKYGRGFEAKDGYDWLLVNAPEAAWPAVMAGLQDSSKVIRDACTEFAAAAPEELNVKDDVIPLIESRSKDVRLTGVNLLSAIGAPENLPILEAALKKERSKPVKEAMQMAIVGLTAKGLDVSSFEQTKKGDKALDKALADLPGAPLPSEVEEGLGDLPAPSYESGEAMSAGALRWFLGEICGENGEQARAVRARLADKSCHALCEALLKLTRRDDMGWGLQVQGHIGGPKQIESLGSRMEQFAQSQAHGWSGPAVDVLVTHGTDQAARILDDWAQRTRSNALKSRAAAGVRRIAAARGLTVDELMEQAMGTLGFDESRTRVFDYGSRKVVVRLSPTGDDLLYEDEDGGSFKSMPNARKDDDAALVKAARAEVSQIKKDMKRLRRSQTRRLEAAMANGRRWVPEVWLQRFAGHPLMRSFAFGLVWGIYGEDGALKSAFQLDDDGKPVDLDFEEPTWGEGDRIGLVHPLDLGDDRAAWLESLADYERVQPFNQLQRRVFTKEEIGEFNKYLVRMDGVDAGKFLGRLNRLAYELGPREDAGLINYSYRSIGSTVITLNHYGFSPEGLDWADKIDISDVAIKKGDEWLDLSAASPLIYSEVLHDIHVLLEQDEG